MSHLANLFFLVDNITVFVFQGATIRRDPFSDRIAIARIFHGGAAHRTGTAF